MAADFYGVAPEAFARQLLEAAEEEFLLACSDLARALKGADVSSMQREGIKSLRNNFERLGQFYSEVVFEKPPPALPSAPAAKEEHEAEERLASLLESCSQLSAQLKALSALESAFHIASLKLNEALAVEPVLSQIDADKTTQVFSSVKRLRVLHESAAELRKSSSFQAPASEDAESRFARELRGMPSSRVMDQVTQKIREGGDPM